MHIATDSMKNILMRLANTIVANLDNTIDDSLIDGKTGVALFLYEYGSYSGCSVYSDIASGLMSDVMKNIKLYRSPETMDMLGSISLGAAMLSEYGYSDSSEMEMSDNTVLRFPEAFARNCRQGGLRLYQPGMYLYHRMNCEKFKPEASLYSMMITGTSALLDKMMKGQGKRLDTGVTLSIIYAFSMKRSDLSDYDRDIKNIIDKCFDILSGNFGKRYYLDKDIIILRHIANLFPENLFYSKDLLSKPDIQSVIFNMDMAYKDSWEMFLYSMDIFDYIDNDVIDVFIKNMCFDMFYDIDNANSRLAGLGLCLLRNGKNE